MENLKKHRAIDAPLEVEKLSLTQELDLLKASIAESRQLAGEFTTTKQDVEQVKEVLGGLEGERERKEKELAELQASISEIETAQQAVLSVVAQKQAEKDFLLDEITMKKEQAKRVDQEVARLTAEKQDLSSIKDQKETQKDLLESINQEIVVSMRTIATLEGDIAVLDKSVDGLKSDLRMVEQEITTKEQEMAEREGVVSIKEVNNEKREKRLKKLKEELEVYYNRKFNFIS